MNEVVTTRHCERCYFCRRLDGALCCVKDPPIADRRTGRARWPQVEPTDTCGGFRYADGCPLDTDHWPRNALPLCTDAFGDYCKIPLTQGRFAKVAPADYLWLSQFRWCSKIDAATCYAVRHIQVNGRTRRIFMHRQIMNTPPGLICDHINHDGLDNRPANLRNCTVAQNNANRRSAVNASSQYVGVSRDERRGKWIAAIKKNGHQKTLGQFEREEDAARAYDDAARILHGPYANLNLPEGTHHRGTKDTEPETENGETKANDCNHRDTEGTETEEGEEEAENE